MNISLRVLIVLGALLSPGFVFADARLLQIDTDCNQSDELVLTFDKAVDPSSATNKANYEVRDSFGDEIKVQSATLLDAVRVQLSLQNEPQLRELHTLQATGILADGSSAPAVANSLNFELDCVTNCYSGDFSSTSALSGDWQTSSTSGAFGSPRVINSGRLRLTDSTVNNATLATLLHEFPGRDNFIEIEFTHYAYAGTGAEGIAIVFSDAKDTVVSGGYGGSLGYAQLSGTNGFSGGWLGVGVDEHGDFSDDGDGRSGGVGPRPDSVALRGSGNNKKGYPFLFSTGTLAPGVDQGSTTLGPAHRYRISLDNSRGGPKDSFVSVERDTGSGYQEIVPRFNINSVNKTQAPVPQDFSISLTGSTGASTNIHEISDFKVCSRAAVDGLNRPHHYHIAHAGTGLTCDEEEVTITAHDEFHNPVQVSSDTDITVTASPNFDDVQPAQIRILSGQDSVVMRVRKTTEVDGLDIDLTDGVATDLDGDATEDPPMNFRNAGFRFYADGVLIDNNQALATQISGKPNNVAPNAQDLSLAIVETNTLTGVCEQSVRGTTGVDVGFSCVNPSNCIAGSGLEINASNTVTVNGANAGEAINFQTVQMEFDDQGTAPFSLVFGDAGALNLSAKVTLPGQGGVPDAEVEGESTPIIFRPFALHMDINGQRDADLADDGLINESINLNKEAVATSIAASAADSKFIAAADPFNVNVRAVVWQAVDDANNDGVPDASARLADNALTQNFGREDSSQAVAESASLFLPSPALGVGVLGISSLQIGGPGSTFSGGASSLTATYSEVGIVDIFVNVQNYLGGSSQIVGSLPRVGRFIPAQFNLAFDHGEFDHACGTFSYIGQPIEFRSSQVPGLLLSARNRSGNPTLNYSAPDFMKLEATGVSRTMPANDQVQLDTAGVLMGVQPTFDPLYPDGQLVFGSSNGLPDGTVRYQFGPAEKVTYVKTTNSEVAPFSSDLRFELSALVDSDGVTSPTLGEWVPASTSLRYGRWNVYSVSGPSSQALPMPSGTEYLDATLAFVTNAADSCSTLNGVLSVLDTNGVVVDSSGFSNITVGAGQTSLTYNEPILSGDAGMIFSAPNESGSLEVQSDLSAVPWLRHNWLGTGLEDTPSATALFGQFRGHDRVIFWREFGVEP